MKIKTRQYEIIEAAGELLMEGGVNGLTTKNLALKMGFTESALYRHFKDKEDIIVTMLQYLNDNMNDRLKNCISNEDTPEKQFRLIFKNQFSFFDQKPHFLVAVFSDGLMKESQKVSSAVLQLMATLKMYLMPIIKNGQKKGVFVSTVNTEDLTHIVMGAFRFQMLQWSMMQFSFSLIKKGDKLINDILTLITIKK